MGINKYREGRKYISKDGYKFRLIEYINFKNCTIKFYDGSVMYGKNIMDIENGRIKKHCTKKYKKESNNLIKGCLGQDGYYSKDKSYKRWKSMFSRCESNPTYKDCSVHSDWFDYVTFAKWCGENYIDGYHLDKDILIKGNKVYGPDTCCFVPREINQVFVKKQKSRGDLPIGVTVSRDRFRANVKNKHLGRFNTPEKAFAVYKIEKEKIIKEVAENWKNKISPKVYEALMNYKVEITD